MYISLPVSFLVGTAIASQFGSARYSNNFGQPGINATYDYIIVGGGTAGLALAYRLAANASLTVAVIEAGGFYEQENGNRTLVPGYYNENLRGPSIDWNFSTTSQPQLYGSTVTYARGKTLGGSSALNAMLYQIGTNDSYTAWADAVGDDSYQFEHFHKYFQTSANFSDSSRAVRPANASVPLPISGTYIPTGGPLHVSHPNDPQAWASWAQLAMRELGVPDVQDFSSGKLIGSQYCPLSVRPDDQTRSSSESSFLQSAFIANEMNSNLKVYIHSLAKVIEFDDQKKATGVLVRSETGGPIFKITARNEVIVSAGAFQSPQLLMVSGIGPKEILDEHGIEVFVDALGVGKNMWDHVLFPTVWEANVPTIGAVSRNATLYQEAAALYLKNQTSILTTNNADYLGWEKLPKSLFDTLSPQAQADLNTFPTDWPDLEFVFGSYPPQGLNVTFAPGDLLKNLVFVETALITPLSRGFVSINSSDLADPPVIDVGWLTNDTDIETAVAGIKRARQIFATQALQPALIGKELVPGPNITDADLPGWIRGHVQTVYHASCTCKMGMESDPMAVIDSKARVRGVTGLRVVDASSFPFLVPGHPQSTIYALAEKIADHILKGI